MTTTPLDLLRVARENLRDCYTLTPPQMTDAHARADVNFDYQIFHLALHQIDEALQILVCASLIDRLRTEADLWRGWPTTAPDIATLLDEAADALEKKT